MFTFKTIILLSFTLLSMPYVATITEETDPSDCKNTQLAIYKKFYTDKANIQKYDLMIPFTEVEKSKCYYQTFKVDGSNVTVLWYDIAASNIPGYTNLYISQEDASDDWELEEDLEFPILSNSMNQYYLEKLEDEKNQNDNSRRKARMSIFMKPIIQKTLNDFDINKKTKYFKTLYVANKLNLEMAMNLLYVDFFSVLLVKQQPHLTENFENDVIKALKIYGNSILQNLEKQFQAKLTPVIGTETFKKVSTDKNFIKQEYDVIVNALEDQMTNGGYGRNAISKAFNNLVNTPTEEMLFDFLTDYNKKIDKKLDSDFEYSLNDNEDHDDIIKDIFGIMKNFEIYTIQFYLLEQFELAGDQRVRTGKVDRTGNFGSDCAMITNKQTLFMNLALEEGALIKETMTTQNLLDAFVRCEKQVSGNEEVFKFVFKPANDKTCVIFYTETTDLQGKSKIDVKLDTWENYGTQLSCMRYSRGLKEMRMMILI